MARGDVKQYRGRGGGYGGSGGGDYYDEGRGYSKEKFEEFKRDFEKSGHDCNFPNWLDQSFLYNFWKNATYRYNKHDWRERANELVLKHCGPRGWNALLEYLDEAKEAQADREFMNKIGYSIARIGEHKDAEAREAERIAKLDEEVNEYRQEADLTSGFLQADFQSAFKQVEVVDQPEGDWIDNPVDLMITGHGWGEEVKVQTGVKLQITLSLDISNSMYYNDVCEAAAKAFVNLWLAMENLKADFPDSLFIKSFIFSGGQDGKMAKVMEQPSWRREDLPEWGEGAHLGDVHEIFEYLSNNVDRWNRWNNTRDLFSGEDTWMTPLFEKIEKWEKTDETDNGAVRLDLVISDAVLEHPKDLRESSVIQERRDGSLQTIILNLMPEEEWHNSALPRRCYQYPVDKDNLRGMLRNILGEFVSVYM